MIGALVPPVLLSLLAARAMADGWIQLGLVSEQIFRGERLPNLNMSMAQTPGDHESGSNHGS